MNTQIIAMMANHQYVSMFKNITVLITEFNELPHMDREIIQLKKMLTNMFKDVRQTIFKQEVSWIKKSDHYIVCKRANDIVYCSDGSVYMGETKYIFNLEPWEPLNTLQETVDKLNNINKERYETPKTPENEAAGLIKQRNDSFKKEMCRRCNMLLKYQIAKYQKQEIKLTKSFMFDNKPFYQAIEDIIPILPNLTEEDYKIMVQSYSRYDKICKLINMVFDMNISRVTGNISYDLTYREFDSTENIERCLSEKALSVCRENVQSWISNQPLYTLHHYTTSCPMSIRETYPQHIRNDFGSAALLKLVDYYCIFKQMYESSSISQITKDFLVDLTLVDGKEDCNDNNRPVGLS